MKKIKIFEVDLDLRNQLEVSVGGVSPDVHRVHFHLETYVF